MRLLLPFTLFMQALLVYMAYTPLVKHPTRYVFVKGDDGLKNNFTLLSYVQSPAGDGLWHYGQMNYPFGEGVLYTDNMPLLAATLKTLAPYSNTIQQQPLAILNLLLMANFLILTALLVLVLKRFVRSGWLVAALALALPWLHPMFLQLNGPASLSLSALVMLHIYALIKWYESTGNRAFLLWCGVLIAVLYLSFFIHGYYLFIMAFTTGFFCLFTAIRLQQIRSLAAAFLVPAMAIGLAATTLALLDTELAARSNQVMGYNWSNWQLNSAQLLLPGNLIAFITRLFHLPEVLLPHSFLGAGFLFTVLLLLIVWLWRKQSLFSSSIFKRPGALALVLAITGIAMTGMALGEDFYLFQTRHHFYNIFNPLFYLRRVVPQLNHLRFADRFFYPAFFMLWLALAYVFDAWLHSSGSRAFKYVVLGIVILLLGAEALQQVQTAKVFPNTLRPGYFTENTGLSLPAPNTYQAILPIPFYHVGSEEAGYTMETPEEFLTLTMALAAESKLPLMSCKLSRTPEYQSRALIDMLASGVASPEISRRLNNKPILVVYSKLWDYRACSTCVRQITGPAVQAFKNGFGFIGSHNGKLLQENDNFGYYSITIK